MKIGCVYCDAKGRQCPNPAEEFLCEEHGGKLTLEEQALLDQANQSMIVIINALTTPIDRAKANYLMGRTLDRLTLLICQRANMAAMRDRSDSLKRRAP